MVQVQGHGDRVGGESRAPKAAQNPPQTGVANNEVTRALRRKKKLRKRARCKPEELSRYNVAKKQAANAVRKVMLNFEKKLAKDKSKNSKPFYAYLKGKRKSRTEWDHYETRTKT
jgi:hypothetical protein